MRRALVILTLMLAAGCGGEEEASCGDIISEIGRQQYDERGTAPDADDLEWYRENTPECQ